MAAKDADLSSFLARSEFRRPVLFLYGSDADFVDSAVSEAIDRIRQRRPDLGGVERVQADAVAASPPLLLDFFGERALFGEDRFLVIGGLTERQASVFAAFFKDGRPAPGPLLLLSSSALTTKSKLLAAARDSGFCDMIRAYEAPFSRQDLSERLAEQGVATVEPQALDTAHRRLAAEDPATRAQTVRLLALYADDGRLGAEDVERCLPPSDDQLAGELLECVLSGDARALIAWRRRGAAEGVEPIAQLALAARALGEARRARLATFGRQGGPPVFWKTEKTVKEAARRAVNFDDKLDQALTAAHGMERAARSSEGLIAEKTERLMLRLAQIFG